MSKTFDQGKEEIVKLCQYFVTNRQAFLAPGVKEAHVRQTLIDPFFAALGWDVRNSAMIAPQYREVIPEWQLIGNPGGIARTLECVAFVWLHQADKETARESNVQRAATLLGAAEKLREAIHATMLPPEQSEYQEHVAGLRERLDDARLKAAWADGRTLTMEQAIELALRVEL